jgi:hypothetical protein
MKLMKKFSYKKLIITGVLVGLSLEVKQSNLLLFLIIGLIYFFWYLNIGKLKNKLINKKLVSLICILIISIITFVILWPMPYWHLDIINKINQQTWLVKTAPPIIFWGKLIQSPVIYFLTFFFISTPLAVIILMLAGFKKISNEKKWIGYSFIIWLAIPFFQSFYVWRVHGLRYIIEIYAPLSIIAAIGLGYITEKLKFKNKGKIISLTIVFLYLLIIIYQIKPYYLDYFNELVGGTKGVSNNKYFELGWWGQGLREAGYYLRDNARKGSSVGLFISPPFLFPPTDKFKLIFINPNTGVYNPNIKYDYIVVNDYHVLREGFDDSKIRRDYKLFYQVKASGASIVNVYQSK